MGNTLSSGLFGDRPTEPTWSPNIAPDQPERFNNVNRPYSVQMREMVLQFAVPLFFIAAFAARESLHRTKESDLSARLEGALRRSRQERDDERDAPTMHRDHQVVKDRLRDVIASVETEAEQKRQQNLETIDLYDKSLKEIMHIKCSLFKKKGKREKMEEQLVKQLDTQNADLYGIATYSDVQNVIKHDAHFCGDSKETNGRLRQLYVQNWKLQLQLEKQRAVLRKIKEVIYPKE